MNTDDLLSFKEYSPIHESHAQQGGSAEINVNSPNRKQRSPYQTTTTSNQTLNDPLTDLINSMSASVNVLHNEDRQRSPTGKKNVFDLKKCKLFRNHLIFCVLNFFRGTRWKPTNRSFHIQY